MAAIGVFGISGLSRLNSNIADGYTGNTVPIADLSDLREASLDIRLQLRQMQAVHDQGKTTSSIETIHSDQARINKAWNHYYPDGISSDKEREVAEKIKNALPQFKTATDETVVAFSAGNYDAAEPLIEKVTAPGDVMKDALNQDAVDQSESSQTIYRRRRIDVQDNPLGCNCSSRCGRDCCRWRICIPAACNLEAAQQGC
jgi:hypothetical protein